MFTINVTITHPQTFKSQFFLSTSILQHPPTFCHIQKIQNLVSRPTKEYGRIEWWLYAINRTTILLHSLGKKLLNYADILIKSCKMSLLVCQSTLSFPFDTFLQIHVAKIHYELKIIEMYEAKGAHIQYRLHWLKIGDRVSKEFFQRLRPPRKSTQFKPLMDQGNRLTSLPGIVILFTKHYTQVFLAQQYSLDRLVALQACKDVILNQLSKVHKLECNKPLSFYELSVALYQMAYGKALGLDGFPYEFYIACQEFVGPDLDKVYSEVMFFGSLGPLIN